MRPFPRLRASAHGAALGIAAAAVLAVADGALAVFARPEAGGLADRLGTLMGAFCVYGPLLALAGGALGGLLARPRSGAGRAAAVTALSLLVALVVGLLSTPERGPSEPGGTTPSPSAPERGPADRRWNAVLVVIDTLRADHLPSFGYARDTAPHLAALARQGTLFESAFSTAAWTLPAHATLFTGLDSVSHGVEGPEDTLTDRHATLAEALSAAGYWTGAWVGTPPYGYVGSRYGFDAGFDLYRQAPHPRRFLEAPLAGRIHRRLSRWLDPDWLDPRFGGARAQVDAIGAWLRAARREPFFLFVNFYDVHSRLETNGLPYRAPEPFRERFCPAGVAARVRCRDGQCATNLLEAMERGQITRYTDEEVDGLRCLYDGAVAYVDHELGRLLAELTDLGLDDRTVVMVVADHGEAFFEHDKPLHMTLHDEILRIPLIVRVPGGAQGRRVAEPVRLLDVMPTLLDLLGVAAPEGIQGQSLAPVLFHWDVAPKPAVTLSTRFDSAALRRGDYKLIEQHGVRGPAYELYQVSRDPGERLDLAGHEVETLAEMRTALDAERRSGVARRLRLLGDAPGARVSLSEEERERLRALGYGVSEAGDP